ncbi:MAG TPA: tRNA-dihydrouridine synthase family protein [Candidatus Lokiarchaeia archaeon]|nr:tRNA-dihydrouridine synthase family protein [Candidatus Lokiarchaeia archaeon]
MKQGSSILAPMMGITDHPGFLYSCKMKGCEVIVLPMMFLEGIAANSGYIEDVLNVLFNNVQQFDFRPIIVQLTGKNLDMIDQVIQVLSNYDIQGINLNMGCPSYRIMAQGLGASILDRPEECYAMIDAITKRSSFPVSVKMRLFGVNQPDIVATIQFCKSLEDRNIDWIAVHGRTRRQGYKGGANWDAIKEIHEASNTFLVGNGDITSWKQGSTMIEQGYCDTFMIGRAAVSDPRVFSQSFEPGKTKTPSDALELFKEITGFLIENGDQASKMLVPHEIRKWALALSRQVVGGRSFRADIMKATDLAGIEALFEKLNVASQ